MAECSGAVEAVKVESAGPFDRLCHSDERERWLEMRSEGIGASESAAIMGMSPFVSEYTLYQERVGAIESKAHDDNRYMTWGRRLEPVIAAAYAEDTGREVFRNGWLCRSTQYPWLLATPDYDQLDPEHGHGLLECKTTGENNGRYWEESIPPYYQCQLQHQLLVTGVTWGTVACLIGGNDDRFGNLAAHERFQRALASRTDRFMRMVKGELPPPVPDAHPSTSETLMHMVETGEVVKLPDMALYWHEQQLKYRAQERDAHDRRKEYEALLHAAIGTASYGALPDGYGFYKFVTVSQPDKLIPAYTKRQLRHVKKLPKPKKASK